MALAFQDQTGFPNARLSRDDDRPARPRFDLVSGTVESFHLGFASKQGTKESGSLDAADMVLVFERADLDGFRLALHPYGR
jgi:hypothetical protein